MIIMLEPYTVYYCRIIYILSVPIFTQTHYIYSLTALRNKIKEVYSKF